MTQGDDRSLIMTIAELARDAGPVRPLASPVVRAARWLGAASVLGSLAVVALGVRADLADRFHDPVFVGLGLLLAALTAVSAGSALLLAVPGAGHARLTRVASLVLVAGWAALLIWQVARAGGLLPAGWADVAHLTCPLRMAVVGVVPGLGLFAMVRGAAPLDPRWAAACAGLGAVGLGAVGTQMVCADDAAVHLLVWHFVPAMIGVGLLARLGTRLLRPR